MKVLVTGGAGFIGSHLVCALMARKNEVAVIDDFNDFYDPGLKRDNVRPFLSNPLFKLHELDIRDSKKITGIFEAERPDAVYHLAARAGVRPSIKDPLLYEDVNCMGTVSLLEASRRTGVRRFIFASSSSVYGVTNRLPFSEDDAAIMPISPYAATKRAGELMCHAYHHLHGMAMTCLRFFTVYGERGRPDMAVARFTRLMHEGREIEVFGDGSQKRDFTYISDIIAGALASLDRDSGYEVINLGGQETTEVSTLISIIEQGLGKKALVRHLPRAEGDVPITYADVSKAKRLLGYAPEVRITEGVGRYVKWFLEREMKKP